MAFGSYQYITEISVSDSADGIKHMIEKSDSVTVSRRNEDFIEIEATKKDAKQRFGPANPYVEIGAEFKYICEYGDTLDEIHKVRKNY